MKKGVEEGVVIVEEENSEDERLRRSRIRRLKKKAINASCRFTHSLKKTRGKSKIDYRFPIEDVRDEQEESAVFQLRHSLLHMPPNHDHYHTLLRYFLYIFQFNSINLLFCFIQGTFWFIIIIIRFLKARDFNIEKTIQMWEDMVLWRKQFGTDTILKVRFLFLFS